MKYKDKGECMNLKIFNDEQCDDLQFNNLKIIQKKRIVIKYLIKEQKAVMKLSK